MATATTITPDLTVEVAAALCSVAAEMSLAVSYDYLSPLYFAARDLFYGFVDEGPEPADELLVRAAWRQLHDAFKEADARLAPASNVIPLVSFR